MRLLSLRSSLLLLRRRNGSETPPHSDVISVTENITLTAADTGKTYSLDGEVNLTMPPTAEVTAGWTINVQATDIAGIINVSAEDTGKIAIGGSFFDNAFLQSLDAKMTVTYDGTYFQVVATSGTVIGS